MRIPTYVSERNVSAPMLQTPQVPQPIKLDALIQGVEQKYGEYKQQEEEEFKLFTEAEAQRTGFEIDKLYAELNDRIDNGGSYANAQAEFQKKYEALTNGSIAKFGDDDRSRNAAERVKLSYERSGLEYGLKLKSAVRSRAKRDAAAAASQREDAYGREYVYATTEEEKKLVLQKYSQSVTGLESSGVIDAGSGRGKVAKFVQNGEENRVKLMMQSDPTKALSHVEEMKPIFSPEKYIELRGQAMKAQKSFTVEMSVEQTKNFVETAKRAARGELTAEDYADKENPVVKAAMNEYTPYEPSEIVDVKLSLASRMMVLDEMAAEKNKSGAGYKVPEWAKTNEGVTKAVADIRQFQDDVIEAKARGAFTGQSKDSYLTMLKKTNQILGDMKLAIEEPETSWSERLKFGVQQPEIYVAELANSITKDIPLQGIRDWETKTEFRDQVMQGLGEWKSSGNRNKDEATINAVAKTVARQMVEDGFPHLRGSVLLKEADRVVGDGVDIKITPDRAVKMKDIDAELKAIDEELKNLGTK